MSTRRSTPAVRVWLAALTLALASGCTWLRSAPPVEPEPQDAVRTGYGAVDQGEVLGSVSSLSGDNLENARESHVGDLLWGRIPGLDVARRADGSFSLRIRGVSSFLGNGEPLVVVDGVPLHSTRELWALSPKGIDRVDVLKDGSSTAIYGTRGANGVIVITTTRPR